MKDVEPDEDIPRITSAEITDDGAIIVKFDRNVVKGKKKAVFLPEALFDLAQEYGEIETEGDFAGLPFVYSESIFSDEEDGPEEEAPGDPEKAQDEASDEEMEKAADEIFGPEIGDDAPGPEVPEEDEGKE